MRQPTTLEVEGEMASCNAMKAMHKCADRIQVYKPGMDPEVQTEGEKGG